MSTTAFLSYELLHSAPIYFKKKKPTVALAVVKATFTRMASRSCTLHYIPELFRSLHNSCFLYANQSVYMMPHTESGYTLCLTCLLLKHWLLLCFVYFIPQNKFKIVPDGSTRYSPEQCSSLNLKHSFCITPLDPKDSILFDIIQLISVFCLHLVPTRIARYVSTSGQP